MPHSIVISDEDVARVAEAMGCQFDDAARREALLCTDCRDIQACPGSGKTTLVVAKLMILAEHWQWDDRGVCVLSHTNVAREEVEKRLAQHPTGHRLLQYPHFIGTIQKFVDEFLALPCSRNKGLEVSMIDNDRFARRAEQLLPHYGRARAYLSHRRDRRSIVSGLRFEGADLMLGSACESGLTVGQGTPTHTELTQLKWRICHEGVFRFDDMYAFAEAYVNESPEIIEGLRLRFPWVFVDEMQDSDAMQDDLLRTLFGEQCILQRFGDANQAIYGGESAAGSQATFPRDDPIRVIGSMRFGSAIARFASRLTAVVPQQLTGLGPDPRRRHTIFLSGVDAISHVLPRFGELLATEYSVGLPPGYVAKAVGFRKSEPGAGTQRRMPFNIGDYWHEFEPMFTVRSPRPSTLIEFVMLARDSTQSQGECCDGYRMITEGLLELLRLQAARDGTGATFTKTRLFEAFENLGHLSAREFRALLANLCLPATQLGPQWWNEVNERLSRLIEPWSSAGLTTSAQEFLRWVEQPERLEVCRGRVPTRLLNVYRHDSALGPVDIEVTTIHAVKGQTHDATLLLETYWEGRHDLAEMVKFLVGERSTGNLPPGNTLERMKRVFVAMTRPRELLCLAMHRDHVTAEQRVALAELGWSIEDVSA
jgi:hypothetical protein